MGEYVGQYPHTQWTSGNSYPNTIWYSLPGSCPTMDRFKATPKCNYELPGGACASLPTGQGNCTFHIEEAGELDIDTLVGIRPRWKNRAEFCKQCKTEVGPNQAGGCGLDFWGPNIWDKDKNARRVQKTADEFDRKYPEMPKTNELSAPPCDFDQKKYGFSWGSGKPQSVVHKETVGQSLCAQIGCGSFVKGNFCQCSVE